MRKIILKKSTIIRSSKKIGGKYSDILVLTIYIFWVYLKLIMLSGMGKMCIINP